MSSTAMIPAGTSIMQLPVPIGGAPMPIEAEFNIMVAISAKMAQARIFPHLKSAEQHFAAMMLGRDLGLSPTAAMAGCFPIPGKNPGEFKIGFYTNIYLAVVQARMPDFEYKVLEWNAGVCHVEGGMKGGQRADIRLTLEDAKRRRWSVDREGKTKGAWFGNSEDMLFNRCIGRVLKMTAAAALYGLPVVMLRAFSDDDEEADAPEREPSSAVVVEEAPKALPPTRERIVEAVENAHQRQVDSVDAEQAAAEAEVDAALGTSPPAPRTVTRSAQSVAFDHKMAFVQRASMMYGKADRAKLAFLAQQGLKECGLGGTLPIKSSADIAPHEWPRLWAWLDERYDEQGQKRFTDEATGESAVEVRPASAVAASSTAPPAAADEPVELPPVAEPERDPVAELLEGAEAGIAAAVVQLATWAQGEFGGSWIKEHPEGTGRLFLTNAVTLRAADFFSVKDGRTVAGPAQIISVSPNDREARVVDEETMTKLGNTLAGVVRESIRAKAAEDAKRTMPARAGAALAAARGGGR